MVYKCEVPSSRTYSSDEVYSREIVNIPAGYEVVGFGMPIPGDVYLPVTESFKNKPKAWTATVYVQEPRLILRPIPEAPKPPTPADIYGPGTKIPEGYTMVDFRPLKEGDLYVSSIRDTSDVFTAVQDHSTEYRWIVTKNPKKPVEKVIRVVRVLEYTGPESWVNNTLSKNAITPTGPGFELGYNKQIRELSTFREEVK